MNTAVNTPTNNIRTPGQESTPIPLADIEQELSRRIRALQTSPEQMILPARMSNVMIWCDKAERVDEINAAIPGIMAVHPARVILLIGEAEAKPASLAATVTVRSHAVKGEGGLCSEQITLRARGAAVQDLPFVVMGLLIGDLPINLWWTSTVPPPLAGVLFHDLSANVEQVVYDSIGWADPARGVVAVAAWIRELEQTPRSMRWRLAADLNWRRLKSWRRLLSQALDPATAPGFLDSIHEVTIEHGPHAVIQAWELVSWLASRLGWQVKTGKVQGGVELKWQFSAPQGAVRVILRRLDEGRPTIYRVHIQSGKGGLRLVVGSERRLAVIPEGSGAPRTVTVPPQPLAQVVGRELSDRDRDPVFRDSLQFAQLLAKSVLS